MVKPDVRQCCEQAGLDDKDRKYLFHFMQVFNKHSGLGYSHWWGLSEQTGNSGQCSTVIGLCSLICDCDKEHRKEACG